MQTYGYRLKLQRWLHLSMPLTGLMLLSAMAALFWWWETGGRERYLYEEVVVLKEDVSRGTLISADMVVRLKVETGKTIGQAIADERQVVGLEAKQFIPKGAQLHPRFFEAAGPATGGRVYNVKLPNEWLYSVPNSLRRKDTIALYEVTREAMDPGSGSGRSDSARTNPAETSGNRTAGADETVVAAASGAGGAETVGEFVDRAEGGRGKQPVLVTAVNFVKDSGNREVVTVSREERLDGSSPIREIEVNLTPEELGRLEAIVKKGSKFIVMYMEGDDDETGADER